MGRAWQLSLLKRSTVGYVRWERRAAFISQRHDQTVNKALSGRKKSAKLYSRYVSRDKPEYVRKPGKNCQRWSWQPIERKPPKRVWIHCFKGWSYFFNGKDIPADANFVENWFHLYINDPGTREERFEARWILQSYQDEASTKNCEWVTNDDENVLQNYFFSCSYRMWL